MKNKLIAIILLLVIIIIYIVRVVYINTHNLAPKNVSYKIGDVVDPEHTSAYHFTRDI